MDPLQCPMPLEFPHHGPYNPGGPFSAPNYSFFVPKASGRYRDGGACDTEMGAHAMQRDGGACNIVRWGGAACMKECNGLNPCKTPQNASHITQSHHTADWQPPIPRQAISCAACNCGGSSIGGSTPSSRIQTQGDACSAWDAAGASYYVPQRGMPCAGVRSMTT